MFKINDEVYHAQYERKQRWIVCPDCMGKKFLTVIMGDDTQHTIGCMNCVRGYYEGSTGRIETYDYEMTVTKRKITGMEISPERTEYKSHIFIGDGGSSYYTLKEEDMFVNEAEAVIRGNELKAKAKEEEAKRLQQKHDHNRSWAWNASYHRGRIRSAQKELIYHTAQLEIAKNHSKDNPSLMGKDTGKKED